MQVLVAGATGSVGGKIARALLARGDSVRALVRPRTDATALERDGVEVVRGDVKDPQSLPRACAGADALVSTVTMSGRGDDSPENVDARGNQNLFDAAREAGVGHAVFVSTILADPKSAMPVFRAKGIAEDHLSRGGAMSYTILQCNAIMDVWFPLLIEGPIASGAPVTLVGESRRRHSFVAERDVAALAVAAIGHPDARNVTIRVGGPEAIGFLDVVAAYERSMGRKIPARSVAPGELIPGVPEQVSGFAAALETFDSPIPMEETARRFGITLTSLQEFVGWRVATAARG